MTLKEYLLTEMLMGLFHVSSCDVFEQTQGLRAILADDIYISTDTNSKGKNAKSAIKNGHLLSDSLADWVRLQLIAGPYDPEEIPYLHQCFI